MHITCAAPVVRYGSHYKAVAQGSTRIRKVNKPNLPSRNLDRRQVLLAGAALLAAPFVLTGRVFAAEGGAPLPIPPILEADGAPPVTLTARKGSHAFVPGTQTPTLGYEADYLGPTLRVRRGRTAQIDVINRTDDEVTAHWHGAHVPGNMDGGPQTAFAPGASWAARFDVHHPAATLWYHSHVHGKTGPQVYHGLAGLLLVDDPAAPDGLPSDYGVNDIPLVVQDRSFDSAGRLVYDTSGMMSLMSGLHGDTICVNGAVRPVADVPRGLVRLRILNGSNARFYDFAFADGRQFHQVASDGGLLPAPVARNRIALAPAERAEIVVDFSADSAPVRLISSDIAQGGMMGGGMMGGGAGSGGTLDILTFSPGAASINAPVSLPASLPAPPFNIGSPVRTREFQLDMHAGSMMGSMFRRLFGANDSIMGINGSAYNMGRIDASLNLGETELWRISAPMMVHPFHVHGCSFQVVSRGGRPVDPATEGHKDVVVVDASGVEILVQANKKADAATPFMLHCHILEHEDAGMMGQFTVT